MIAGCVFEEARESARPWGANTPLGRPLAGAPIATGRGPEGPRTVRCGRDTSASCKDDPQTGVALGSSPGPQCAFEMSMLMCPAVHTTTRSLLRLSSTHEPSDPPLRVVCVSHWFDCRRRRGTTRSRTRSRAGGRGIILCALLSSMRAESRRAGRLLPLLSPSPRPSPSPERRRGRG